MTGKQECEDFIAEITLGNARSSEIKDFIRKQARKIRELETELALIDLKKRERELNKKRVSLMRYVGDGGYF